jgi:hypothetical protein
LSSVVANFAGVPISATMADGSDFTIDRYFREIHSSPVRLYLYTFPKSPSESTSGLVHHTVSATYAAVGDTQLSSR